MVTVGKSGFPYLRRPLCLCWVPVCLCCRYLYPFVMGTCMLVLLIPLCLCCGYLQVLGSLCGYCGYLCVTVGYCGYLCEYWEVSLGFHSVRHVLGFGMLHISFPTYRNGLFVLFGWSQKLPQITYSYVIQIRIRWNHRSYICSGPDTV